MHRRVIRNALPPATVAPCRFGTALVAAASTLRWTSNGSAKLMLSPTRVLQQTSPGYSAPVAPVAPAAPAAPAAPDPFDIAGLRFKASQPGKLTDSNGVQIDRTQLVSRVKPTSQTDPLVEPAWFGLEPHLELWVRRPYFDLWTALTKQLTLPISSGLIVIGNPGIGKSVGGINTIAALSIADDSNRLLVVIRDEACHIFMDGCWFEAPGRSPSDYVPATLAALQAIAPRMRSSAGNQGLPRLLLLYDVKSAKGLQSFPYQSWFVAKLSQAYRVHCVVFASPQDSNYSQCEKDFKTVSRFYVPTWSLQELEAVKDGLNLSPTVDLVARFREVGGIVRRFGDDSFLAALRDDRREALTRGKIDATMDNFSDFSVSSTSKLFQIVPTADYSSYSVAFVSDAARDACFAKRELNFEKDARRMLERAMESNCTNDVKGRLFENVVRFRLRYGSGLLTLKYLGDGQQNSLSTYTAAILQTALQAAGAYATHNNLAVLKLPPVTRMIEFDGDKADGILSAPGLYVPKNSNFPFVDFVVVTPEKEAWMFQVTVSSQHGRSKRLYDAFMAHFRSLSLTPHMVWVGLDDTGVSAAQVCSDKTPMLIPQFSLKLGIKQLEVWLKEEGHRHKIPPFSLLLNTDDLQAVVSELRKWKRPAAVIPPAASTTSSFDNPWKFNF